jgi:hypothetical protein
MFRNYCRLHTLGQELGAELGETLQRMLGGELGVKR